MKKIWIVMFMFFFAFQIQALEVSASRAKIDPIHSATLNSLRHGGYVLYVRHGEANRGEDQSQIIYENCATQKNLSEEGRKQSALYGEALRRLNIPVHYPVSASPFCRTRDTAELAFGNQNVQIDPFWFKVYQLSGNVTPTEQASTLSELTSELEKIPISGTNTVIIAHSFPKGIGLGEIPYLGTVVVRPKGPGNGYDIIDRFSFNELNDTP
ncbi:histidine phosphatase family protein [Paenibacillus guangzhouensis]|uniref:histidine phosphatase family protein n=1 Tax=Paenibacillus guangzhouensis TaxID=1473112 RepID=UPI0012669CE4|nr:histidine phosphatase family protein [Paenibacillus guangzhouensis]